MNDENMQALQEEFDIVDKKLGLIISINKLLAHHLEPIAAISVLSIIALCFIQKGITTLVFWCAAIVFGFLIIGIILEAALIIWSNTLEKQAEDLASQIALMEHESNDGN